MSAAFWLALGFSVLAALVNLAGLLAIRRFEPWGRRNSVLFAAFAAGVLLVASMVQLAPRAVAQAPQFSPYLLLAGYLLMYAASQLLGRGEVTSHEERRTVAAIPVLGIALHSTLDGVAYAAAFSVDIFTGVITVTGLVLHEFPEGIVAYVLLLRGGFSPRRAFALAFLAAAATTPAGLLIAYPFLSGLPGLPLGLILAGVAGALIFVAASHLVPHIEHETGRGRRRAFAAGLGMALLVVLSHRV